MLLKNFFFERPAKFDLFPFRFGALVDFLRIRQIQAESPDGAVDAIAVAFVVQLVLVKTQFAEEKAAASSSAFGDRMHVGDGTLGLLLGLNLEEATTTLKEA